MSYYDSTSANIWVALPSQSTANMQHSKSTELATAESVEVEDMDNACLQALSKGDQSLFAGLVERWQNRLINFFYRSTHNRTDAEDLAQETFLDVYKAAGRYKHKGAFSAFIFTLARRRLIDRYRKKARRPLEFMDPTDYIMQQHSEPVDASDEIEDAFHCALVALPENQRSALLLLQQQGLSYDEIARALNASLSSVKTWIHRARAHLRKQLKDFA